MNIDAYKLDVSSLKISAVNLEQKPTNSNFLLTISYRWTDGYFKLNISFATNKDQLDILLRFYPFFLAHLLET